MANIIRRVARKFGIDIVRYPYRLSTIPQDYKKLLDHHEIDMILDVGANVGQYAMETYSYGYEGKIVSFEPMSKEHAILLKASAAQTNWVIADQMAIGDTDGFIDISISGNSESSSILQLQDYTLVHSPTARFVSTERVRIARLSTIADRYISSAYRPFLKVDVQGYEEKVLLGAADMMSRVQGIHLEFSLTPLYQGEKNMLEIMKMVYGFGFEPYYFMPHPTLDRNGRLMQIDCLFFRPYVPPSTVSSY